MASRKFEGIAMLSMYDDESDDDYAEQNAEQENRGGDREDGEKHGDASMLEVDAPAAVGSINDDNATSTVRDEDFVRAEQQPSQATVPASENRSWTLMDYDHDELTMSPENEESEIGGRGGGYSRDKSHKNPRISGLYLTDTMNESVLESDGGNTAEDKNGVDLLDKFLPPPLKIKCSEELQRKCQKLLEFKRAGISFSEEVLKKKDITNPDFLLHAVRYQDIDEIGSCFEKDVFDPHGFDKSDYYDEIDADLKRELERKKRQNFEFVSTGRQSTTVGAAPKPNVHLSGITMDAAGLSSLPPSTNVIPRDSRQNKKSKWDKIDETHATLLASANVGGYGLGHQKRREEVQKRSSGRKLDRRS